MHVQIGGGNVSEGFNVSQLDRFSQHLLNTASTENPKRVQRFMRKEGSKARTKVRKVARQKVKKKTGDFQRSITRSKPYKYKGTDDSINVYSDRNIAPHSHLIENGHRIVRGGREFGFVPGKKVFATAKKEFRPTFEQDVDAFCDELARGVER